ncbi:translocation/assembly module TamB domain-containing protein [Rheinheimera sp.]|uniref:autotransporter assembly complex protein TamB n=1 Tax=Rheinheimera sp. TaxID=1869214 RepID=UPI0027BB12A7|nr:translocation/assembly module TamB domain-containing protein [Rheinheimera sp.]
MKFSWYLLKRFLLSLLALFLISLALLGTNLSLQLGALLAGYYVPAFTVGSINGDLWRGFTLLDIQYRDEHNQVNIQSLQARLDWRCFSGKSLCLDYLQLDGAKLKLQHAAKTTENNTRLTMPDAPFPLHINRLTVNNLILQQPELQLQLNKLHTALSWQQDQLDLGDSVVDQLTVQLPAAAKAVKTAKTKGWQLPQLPALPDLAAIELPLQLKLKSLVLSDIQLFAGKKALLKLTTANLNANLSHQHWQLALNEFHATEPLLQGQSQMDIKPKDKASVDIQLQLLKQPWLVEQQLDLSLQGPLHTVLLNAQLSGKQLSGEQQASLTGSLDLSKKVPEFDLQLRSEALHYEVAAEASDNAEVAAENTQRSYRLANLQLHLLGSTAELQLKGGTQLQFPDLPGSRLDIDARYQAATARVQLQQFDLQTLGGALKAKASLDLATQQLQSEITLQELQPGLFWADYPGILTGNLTLAASLQPDAIRLNLSAMQLNGDLRDLPLKLQGSLQLEQHAEHWSVQTPQLTLSHGPNQLSAKGVLTEQWDLQIALQMPDLSQSVAQSEGQLQGLIAVTGAPKTPTLTLNLSGNQLNYQDDYALAGFTLSGTLAALGAQPSSLSLKAQDGQAPGLQLQQLDWQLVGTLSEHQSHLQIDSHQLQAVLAMTGQYQKDSWLAHWQEARFKSDMGDWQLDEPMQSNWQQQQKTLRLSPSCWLDKEASLCITSDQPLSATQGAVAVTVNQLDLASLSLLLDQNQSLSGRVDGQLKLGWLPKQLPTLLLQLQGEAGQFNYQTTSLLEVPWQQLTLKAELQNNELRSEMAIGFSAQSEAKLKLKLQQLDKKEKTIDARFQLQQMDLAFLRPLLNDYSQFQALLGADVKATGQLNNPELQGNIQLEQLKLTGRQAPMDIQNASLKLTFNGYQGQLAGELNTPQGGLRMDGNADWQSSVHWFAKLALKGENVSVSLPNTELTLSPDLHFNADASGGRLTGLVNIPKGKIEVDDLPQNATKVSDDEILINTQDLDYVASERWRLSSDVRVVLGDNMQLAAFGLKTKLAGELRVRQNGALPTVHGQVTLQNGTFRAYGQDLQLRKGKLNFNGPADQPLMAIEAIRNPEKTEDGVIAGLRVNGLSDNPVVEVFSTPAKPQANALAYLLMGRDLNSNSSDKSMTTSLIGIGIASSGKLVGQLGEVFGLKELSLDTAGSGTDSKVTVSGYLSPKLQVKYGVGIFNQFGEFTLRYRLMQKLYLEAVQSVNTSVDLLYKVEFD